MIQARKTWKPITDSTVLQMYNEVKEEASRLGYMPKYPVNPTLYSYTNSNQRLGVCVTQKTRYDDSQMIAIHANITQDNDLLRSVLVHEYSHAINPEDKHGARWECIADSIGNRWNIKASRLTNAHGLVKRPAVEPKYIVKCPQCGAHWNYRRMCDSVAYPGHYKCGKCHTALVREK